MLNFAGTRLVNWAAIGEVLEAIAWNWNALQHASAELRADREVVLRAVSQDGVALRYASTELHAHREFVLAAVA